MTHELNAADNMLRANRRNFAKATAAIAASGATLCSASNSYAGEIEHSSEPRRLLKTLKIGMVRVKGDLTTKFQAAKDAGFDGIELGVPGIDVDEVKKAIDQTGLPVDGSVGNTHWQVRHSSPDEATRKKALDLLEKSIVETHAVGGHTVLVVVGKGEDGTKEEVWERSIENLSKVLPLCAELGMTLAIENVWNQFCYIHNGPNDQTADDFVKYVDEFDSPWVGMQFDIGNHWKYGNPADWIRQLGRRVVKLDIKGFSRAANGWKDITEDDLPWADVRNALDEIGFHGWVAAEVGGGDQARLTTIAQQIDNALNIG